LRLGWRHGDVCREALVRCGRAAVGRDDAVVALPGVGIGVEVRFRHS
jgi:hypothetical protein